jgi:tRNA-specific 2-thiouridylase
MTQTVVLAMSGGVDSSVAALLLLEQGFRVVGVTLRLYDGCSDPKAKTCCGLEDAYDARAVAAKLGIEHKVLEHQEAFRALVIQPFVQAYAEGRTPNPCIACNEKVKFGTLWEYARSLGADAVATGHHARLIPIDNGVELRRGRDLAKDQSYVLFPLTLEQRRHTLLPVGEWTKPELREKALAAGLHTAEKEESQDICFVGRGHYSDFLARQLGSVRPGAIKGEDGAILGHHEGIHRFTVGQRQGLGIPAAHPLYVKAIDPATGEITVGPRDSLAPRRFKVEPWHWHCEENGRPGEAHVQVRYHQVPRMARFVEAERTMVLEWLEGPQSVTPGQAAVAYRGDVVLGGGWISGSVE